LWRSRFCHEHIASTGAFVERFEPEAQARETKVCGRRSVVIVEISNRDPVVAGS
jgi:hypothetical protein